jgi:hypothetical protein
MEGADEADETGDKSSDDEETSERDEAGVFLRGFLGFFGLEPGEAGVAFFWVCHESTVLQQWSIHTAPYLQSSRDRGFPLGFACTFLRIRPLADALLSCRLHRSSSLRSGLFSRAGIVFFFKIERTSKDP